MYETSIKIKDIIELFPVEPLFGNKQGTKLKTHWIVFIKNQDTTDKLKQIKGE